MQEKFSGTDLKMNPHIESKLKVWKKDHGFLMSILDKSGVGKNIVLCSDEIWKQHAKAYKGMDKKKDHAWIYYEVWCEIFGKDRATGTGGRDFRDAAEATKILGDTLMRGKDKEFPNEEVAGNDTDVFNSSAIQEEEYSSSSCKRGRPKPVAELDTTFIGVLKEVVEFAREGLSSNKKSKEEANKERRQKLHDALSKCKNLTLRDVLTVGKKLAENDKLMEYFFSLPETAHEAYAMLELDGIAPSD